MLLCLHQNNDISCILSLFLLLLQVVVYNKSIDKLHKCLLFVKKRLLYILVFQDCYQKAI